MTVVVTRDVTARFRGLLASCMLEIAPGVYTAPKMNRAVRVRVWAVLEEWFAELGGGGIVMTWLEPLSAAASRSLCSDRRPTNCTSMMAFFWHASGHWRPRTTISGWITNRLSAYG